MNEPLVLKMIIFDHKLRPLKCNCSNPRQWNHDDRLEQEGIVRIHDTNEPGITCTEEQKEQRCPGCGYYFWFTTGGKK